MRRFAVLLLLLLVAPSALAQTPQQAQQSLTGSGNASYPPGATPVGNSTTATTGGIVNMGIGAVANQFTYICGFSVSPGSASAAITLTVTISPIAEVGGGNGIYTWSVGAPVTAVGVTGATFTQTFTPCLRTPAVNNNPVLNVTALGTGGVNQSAQMWGYTQ